MSNNNSNNIHRRIKSEISKFSSVKHFEQFQAVTRKNSALRFDDDICITNEKNYVDQPTLLNNFVLVGNSNNKSKEKKEESAFDSIGAAGNNVDDSIYLINAAPNTSRRLLEISNNASRKIYGADYQGPQSFSELTKMIQNDEKNKKYPPELMFIEDLLHYENKIEDEHQTNEYFRKIQTDELICFILTLIGIISGLYYHDEKSKYPLDQTRTSRSIVLSLLMISASVILFVIATVLKYLNYLKLYKSALYCMSKDTLVESGLHKGLIFEIILALLHPNLGFHCIFYHFLTFLRYNG